MAASGEFGADVLEFGFVAPGIIASLKDIGNWKSRANAIDTLHKALRDVTDRTKLLPGLAKFVNFLGTLVVDPNFKVAISSMQILEQLIQKVGRDIDPHMRNIVPSLLEKFADSKVLVRGACSRVLHKWMLVSQLQQVVDLVSSGLLHTSWRVREEVINTMIAAMLQNRRASIDTGRILTALVGAMNDQRERVKAVALEALAVLSSCSPPGEVQSLLARSSLREEQRQAATARLNNPMLPTVTFEGLVEHIVDLDAAEGDEAGARPGASGGGKGAPGPDMPRPRVRPTVSDGPASWPALGDATASGQTHHPPHPAPLSPSHAPLPFPASILAQAQLSSSAPQHASLLGASSAAASSSAAAAATTSHGVTPMRSRSWTRDAQGAVAAAVAATAAANASSELLPAYARGNIRSDPAPGSSGLSAAMVSSSSSFANGSSGGSHGGSAFHAHSHDAGGLSLLQMGAARASRSLLGELAPAAASSSQSMSPARPPHASGGLASLTALRSIPDTGGYPDPPDSVPWSHSSLPASYKQSIPLGSPGRNDTGGTLPDQPNSPLRTWGPVDHSDYLANRQETFSPSKNELLAHLKRRQIEKRANTAQLPLRPVTEAPVAAAAASGRISFDSSTRQLGQEPNQQPYQQQHQQPYPGPLASMWNNGSTGMGRAASGPAQQPYPGSSGGGAAPSEGPARLPVAQRLSPLLMRTNSGNSRQTPDPSPRSGSHRHSGELGDAPQPGVASGPGRPGLRSFGSGGHGGAAGLLSGLGGGSTAATPTAGGLHRTGSGSSSGGPPWDRGSGGAGASEEGAGNEINPVAEPEEVLRSTIQRLIEANNSGRKELDWQQQYEALSDARRLVRHHAGVILKGSLHELVRAAVPAVDQLRSFNIKAALLLFQDMFSVLGRAMDRELDECVPLLLRKAGEISNAGRENFLAAEADRALSEMCRSVSEARAANALCACAGHKSMHVRAKVASHLDELLEVAPGVRSVFLATPSCLERTFKTAASFLDEGALETRTYGKRIIWSLKQMLGSRPEFERLVATLSPEALQRRVTDVVDGMNGPPPPPPSRGGPPSRLIGRQTSGSAPAGISVAAPPSAPPAASGYAGHGGAAERAAVPMAAPTPERRYARTAGEGPGAAAAAAAAAASEQNAKLLSNLSSKDHRERCDALGKLAAAPAALAAAPELPLILEAVTARLSDGNSKVVIQALDACTALCSELRGRLAPVLNTLVPALAAALGAGNERVRAAAGRAMDALVGSVEAAMLVQHFSHLITNGQLRTKQMLASKFEVVVRALQPSRPQLLHRYALPAAFALLNDARGDAKAAAHSLLATLAQLVGRDALIDAAGGVALGVQQKVADALLQQGL